MAIYNASTADADAAGGGDALCVPRVHRVVDGERGSFIVMDYLKVGRHESNGKKC